MSRPRTPNLRLRLNSVLVGLSLISTMLVARALDIQVVRQTFYQEAGDARILRDVPITAHRGAILDRNGEALAISVPVSSIWVDPRLLLSAKTDRIGELAAQLGRDEAELRTQLAERSERGFYYLARRLPPDRVAPLIALKIPGVFEQSEFKRYYPAGEVAAHLVGFTDLLDKGQEGVERWLDTHLTGMAGIKRVMRDRKGDVIQDVELLKAAEPGRDLELSVDRRLQYLAYRELATAIEVNKANSGSVVVLDSDNGEILAMANVGSFNPNAERGVPTENMRNRAVTDVFEPGSTIKPFIVAAGLESGKFRPETLIETGGGKFNVAGHTVTDVRGFGLIDVTHVITKSSNIGATKIALELDNAQMYDVLRRFGFGAVSGNYFPGERTGFVPEPKTWRPVEKVTMAYGYRMNVTALQLAQAYAAIADGGRIRQPSFLKGMVSEPRPVIDPSIAADLVAMLETVTGPEGTGKAARVAHYRVGGKSGTSRMAGKGGYAQKRYISLFAGMAPISDPRIVVVVVVNDPTGKDYYGGAVSGPVFSKVMDGALRLMNLAPDDPSQVLLYASNEITESAAESVEGLLP